MSKQRVQSALVLVLLSYSIAAFALTRTTPATAPQGSVQTPPPPTSGESAPAQKSVVDYSGDLYNLRTDPDSVIRLAGDSVAFHHNGAFIECDSAIRMGDYNMQGFGNVRIYKDSTYIYGDRVTYNGYNDIATVYSPIVKLMRDDAVLYAYNQVEFNTKTSIGHFNNGGVIIQRDNVMESERGVYKGDSSEIRFIGQVALRNDNYKIRTDSVSYNINREVITFLAPTFIWDKDRDFLTATSGEYISPRQTYHFTNNAYAMTPSQEFWADTMSYHSIEKEATMYSNIQILDTSQRTIAFGDYGYYNDSLKRGMLTRTPSIISYQEPKRDTVYKTTADSTLVENSSDSTTISATDSTMTNATNVVTANSSDSIISPKKETATGHDRRTGRERRAHSAKVNSDLTNNNTTLAGDSIHPHINTLTDTVPHRDSTQNHQNIETVSTTGQNGDSTQYETDTTAMLPLIEPAKPAPDSTYIRADSIFFTSFAKGLSKTLGKEPEPKDEDQPQKPSRATVDPTSDSTMTISDSSATLEVADLMGQSDSLTKAAITEPAQPRIDSLPQNSPSKTDADSTKHEHQGAHIDSTQTINSIKTATKTDADSIKHKPQGAHIDSTQTINSIKAATISEIEHTDSSSVKLPGDTILVPSLPDSLSNAADTLFRPKSDTKADSLERVLRAYYNVKIYRRDMQSICDSLIGFSVDSMMSMFGRPLLWNENNQIASDRIDLYTKNEELDYADLIGKPFVTQQVTSTIKWDTVRYNQATGRALKVWFRNSEVDRAQFTGNVRNYYYMENNKGRVQQFAVIDCSELMMYFKGQNPRRMTWIGSPSWTFYPIRQIPADQDQILPDFTWEPDSRPRSREEITTRSVRPSERAEKEKLQQPTFPIHERMMEYRQNLTTEGIWHDRNEAIRSTKETFLGSGGRQGLQ